MKLKLLSSLIVLLSLSAQAHQKIKINIDKNSVRVDSVEKLNHSFVKFNVSNVETEKTLGAPELPVKTLLVKGTPEQIKAQLNVQQTEVFSGKPLPVQEQDCRCATDKVKTFQYNESLYKSSAENVTVNYLGAFRGQPISQVVVKLAQYNGEKNQVVMATQAELSINASAFSLQRGDYKDYLILGPANLLEGTVDFANWKRSLGYNVSTETISSPNNTTAAIQALIKTHYDNGIDFVIIVGDESTVPMFRVATTGSNQTPSDLKYYTMDGPQDHIPDMLTSRIAASDAAQVSAQLNKSIEHEQKVSGANKFIGIASNEGSNPSDDQYVRAIGVKYKEVQNSDVVHLHQNDTAKSNPAYLNSELNSGASWLTYLGHGSGTSWPNLNQTYSTTHIRQLNNKNVAKPIIVDVACMNGKLVSGYLGTSFMRSDVLASNSAFGAVAYFGGSVNISWHPPAVMAQGIAFEHLAKKFNHLGEALLAGQLYLSGKWSNKNDVIDNYEWYHLQGDPGLNIGF